MAEELTHDELHAEYLPDEEQVDRVRFDFTGRSDEQAPGLSRRQFVQVLGAGLLIAVWQPEVEAQQTAPPRGGRGAGQAQPRVTVSARLHLGRDGTITVLTGKVEGGQGARAQITQVAAEELRVSPDVILLVMADTDLVPNDGITAGSRTTPSTVPAVRQAAAAARDVMVALASRRLQAPPDQLEVRDGKVIHAASQRELTYAELAGDEEIGTAFGQAIPSDVTLTPVKEWKVIGTSYRRPNARDIVTGAHRFPSDVVRPGMLYGKVLRLPAYGATLTSIDLAPARSMPDVTVVRDGPFVGVAAPTTFQAERALEAIARTAEWSDSDHPSSRVLYDHLRRGAQVPPNPYTDQRRSAQTIFEQTYHVAYAQHAPMEPRAAVAEWDGDNLTVWTGTQNPFGVRGELARAFGLDPQRVRVIVPDFGGGFGGKHTGECAIEAARLARAAGKPVSLRWTRQEEFAWAYFRPAAVIDVQATLDNAGAITSWYFVNINSGRAAIDTPYRIQHAGSEYVQTSPPLRHGSYRALAATANNFARECAMDELAAAAGADPLAFRLAHLNNARLRAVLEDAARRFNWEERVKQQDPNVGVGLACGTEKGSYVAACVEVAIAPNNRIRVLSVYQTFECGAIMNPDNLMSQVQGCIVMGLGPSLREQVRFENGKVLTDSFAQYPVPRFSDLPEMDVHLLNRADLPSVGAGETPIIAIAPAIANAVWHATGRRVRHMPITLDAQ